MQFLKAVVMMIGIFLIAIGMINLGNNTGLGIISIGLGVATLYWSFAKKKKPTDSLK